MTFPDLDAERASRAPVGLGLLLDGLGLLLVVVGALTLIVVGFLTDPLLGAAAIGLACVVLGLAIGRREA